MSDFSAIKLCIPYSLEGSHRAQVTGHRSMKRVYKPQLFGILLHIQSFISISMDSRILILWAIIRHCILHFLVQVAPALPVTSSFSWFLCPFGKHTAVGALGYLSLNTALLFSAIRTSYRVTHLLPQPPAQPFLQRPGPFSCRMVFLLFIVFEKHPLVPLSANPSLVPLTSGIQFFPPDFFTILFSAFKNLPYRYL